MDGNVVVAARWLGGALVLAAVILVLGGRWAFSSLAPLPGGTVVAALADRPAGAAAGRPGPGKPPQWVVLVSSAPEAGDEPRDFERPLEQMLVRELQQRARERGTDCRVIAGDDAARYRQEHPRWREEPLSRVADHFAADYAVDCHVSRVALYEPGTAWQLLRGRASLTVRAAAAGSGPALLLERDCVCLYPGEARGPVVADDVESGQFRRMFACRVSRDVVRLLPGCGPSDATAALADRED